MLSFAVTAGQTTPPVLTETAHIPIPSIVHFAEAATIERILETLPPPKPSLTDLTREAALQYDISLKKLENLIKSESNWNPDAVGDRGCSYGISQINICQHKGVTKEQALNPAWAIEWTAKRMKEGNEWWWSPCSCIKTARNYGLKLPTLNADQLAPNATPAIGNGIVFKYSDSSHVAVIEGYTATGYKVVEGNFEPCSVSRRVVSFNDPYIIGFIAFAPT